MERKKLTLVELSRMYNAKNLARAVNSGVRGTKDNPYTKSEVDSLIDKGKFKGVSFVEISMWERHLLMALGNL